MLINLMKCKGIKHGGINTLKYLNFFKYIEKAHYRKECFDVLLFLSTVRSIKIKREGTGTMYYILTKVSHLNNRIIYS